MALLLSIEEACMHGRAEEMAMEMLAASMARIAVI
jgi:hypothetical protein